MRRSPVLLICVLVLVCIFAFHCALKYEETKYKGTSVSAKRQCVNVVFVVAGYTPAKNASGVTYISSHRCGQASLKKKKKKKKIVSTEETIV